MPILGMERYEGTGESEVGVTGGGESDRWLVRVTGGW